MHLVPSLGARKLADLSPLDIEEAKRYWLTEGSRRTKGKGLNPRTVHHHLAVLHDALAQAVRWRLLVVDPCDAVAPVKVPKRKPIALDTDQAARLIELLAGHEYAYIFRLALGTGMRPGEYVALRWDYVDFTARRVVVQQGIWQVTRRDVRVVGVKSHRSERPISLVGDELALLRQQRRAQAAARLAAAEWEDNGLVFTDGQGRPIDLYRLRRTFKRLLEDAGLPVVNLYSLRRTMASIMHALGVPAKTIASRMGHADTHVLFRHYIKEFDAQDRAAAESMAAALREAGARGTRRAHAEGENE
jgi:integrase